MKTKNSQIRVERSDVTFNRFTSTETSNPIFEPPDSPPPLPPRQRATSQSGIAYRQHKLTRAARDARRQEALALRLQEPPVVTFANWMSVEMTDEERQYFNQKAEKIKQLVAPQRLAMLPTHEQRLEAIDEHADQCATLNRELGNFNSAKFQSDNIYRADRRPGVLQAVPRVTHNVIDTWTSPRFQVTEEVPENLSQTVELPLRPFSPSESQPRVRPQHLDLQNINKPDQPKSRRKKKGCCIH